LQFTFIFFTARCYAERGIATANPSVSLSVCPSVRLSVTLKNRDHIFAGIGVGTKKVAFGAQKL